jgi:hypothetical protein
MMEKKYQPLAMEQVTTNLYRGCCFLCQGDQHKYQGIRFCQEFERMNFSWNMPKPKGEPLYLSRSIAIVILVFFLFGCTSQNSSILPVHYNGFYITKYFWRGRGQYSRGHCLVNWKKVCLPKKHGGSGITDLRTQNLALLLKWLWVLYTKPASLWAVTVSSCYTLPLASQTHMISPFLRDMVQLTPLFQVSIETDAGGQIQWRWEVQKGFITASVHAFLSRTGITVIHNSGRPMHQKKLEYSCGCLNTIAYSPSATSFDADGHTWWDLRHVQGTHYGDIRILIPPMPSCRQHLAPYFAADTSIFIWILEVNSGKSSIAIS